MPRRLQLLSPLKGDKGESGVHIGTEAPTDPDMSVWINPEGEPTENKWETVLETTWDVNVITPLSVDSETGYWECAEEDIAFLDVGEEITVFTQLSDTATAFTGLVTSYINESYPDLKLTKIDATHFTINRWTSADSFDVSLLTFCVAEQLVVENVNSRKIRLTTVGKQGATFGGVFVSLPFTGDGSWSGNAYSQYYGGYVRRYGILASNVIEMELFEPRRVRGSVIGGGMVAESNSNLRYISYASTIDANATISEYCTVSDDGMQFVTLKSGPNLHMDSLILQNGCYVKLERWVE